MKKKLLKKRTLKVGAVNNDVYNKYHVIIMEQKQELGVEITLPKPDSFAIIVESLTRIGMKSKKSNTLYQTCHILHKRGTYRIMHYKEFFALDGKHADICDDDYRRRNEIVKLLQKWGLCVIVDSSKVELANPESSIDIIPYKLKKEWQLISKYTVGKKSNYVKT